MQKFEVSILPQDWAFPAHRLPHPSQRVNVDFSVNSPIDEVGQHHTTDIKVEDQEQLLGRPLTSWFGWAGLIDGLPLHVTLLCSWVICITPCLICSHDLCEDSAVTGNCPHMSLTQLQSLVALLLGKAVGDKGR